MNVVIATEYCEGLREHCGVLWASAVQTETDKINIIAKDILRILTEMENPDGVNLSLKEDTYGETILRTRYGEGTVIEYKCMNGADKT